MLLDNFIRLSCLGLTVYKLMRCLKAMLHDFLIALAFQRRVRLTFVCRLSGLWLTDSFHAEAPLGGELGGGGESGMGDTQQSFIRGVPPPGSNPLPFYILFPTDKVPLSYTVKRPLTATFPFFGAQSVHRRFFKPFSNSHLSTTFFRLKVASSIDDGSHFTSLQNNTAFLVTAVTGPPFEYQ